MVLNLAIRINKAETREMIETKCDFFFKFIEQEVIAVRYQVAQERNYETKNPKKTGGSERTLIIQMKEKILLVQQEKESQN